jgi:hypothetical protein
MVAEVLVVDRMKSWNFSGDDCSAAEAERPA